MLEVPPPVAGRVAAIRREWNSWRVALPVEITLAGSSGAGVLRYHESELDAIFATLDAFARRFAPIAIRFDSVALFPGTKVVYLAPNDPAPLVALHAALTQSGLRFERSPHPFTPHCTLADLEVAATELPADFQKLALPQIEIVLDTLSLVQLDARVLGGHPDGCRWLHRTRLVGSG